MGIERFTTAVSMDPTHLAPRMEVFIVPDLRETDHCNLLDAGKDGTVATGFLEEYRKIEKKMAGSETIVG